MVCLIYGHIGLAWTFYIQSNFFDCLALASLLSKWWWLAMWWHCLTFILPFYGPVPFDWLPFVCFLCLVKFSVCFVSRATLLYSSSFRFGWVLFWFDVPTKIVREQKQKLRAHSFSLLLLCLYSPNPYLLVSVSQRSEQHLCLKLKSVQKMQSLYTECSALGVCLRIRNWHQQQLQNILRWRGRGNYFLLSLTVCILFCGGSGQ